MRRPSGTWAIPRLTISSGPKPAIERPSKTISPAFGLTSPVMARNVVDFPAPFEPSNETTVPSSTEKVTPRSASISP